MEMGPLSFKRPIRSAHSRSACPRQQGGFPSRPFHIAPALPIADQAQESPSAPSLLIRTSNPLAGPLGFSSTPKPPSFPPQCGPFSVCLDDCTDLLADLPVSPAPLRSPILHAADRVIFLKHKPGKVAFPVSCSLAPRPSAARTINAGVCDRARPTPPRPGSALPAALCPRSLAAEPWPLRPRIPSHLFSSQGLCTC